MDHSVVERPMARIAIAGLPYAFIMRVVQRISTLLIVYVCIGSRYAQTDNDCGLERFRCRNGECIAAELLCNGRVDCKDSSDETEVECKNILCSDHSYQCNYGGCINKDDVCDRNPHCVVDNVEVRYQCIIGTRKNPTKGRMVCFRVFTALEFQFVCNNDECISRYSLCNGIRDCTDGSDETSESCGSIPCDGFRCNYGGCLYDRHKLCNGENDCVDGSDESLELCAEIGSSSLPPIQSETTQSPPVLISSSTRSTVTLGTKTCKAPPQPQNGRWMLHRSQCPGEQEYNVPEGTELGLGSHLIYSCNPRYKIIGPTDVSCSIEGIWLNIPVCTVCGTLPFQHTHRSSGGRRPNITEFPWHASMYRDTSRESKKYFCGASIIQENLLITAVHCVYDENAGRVIDANKIYIVTGNIFRDYDSPVHNPPLVKKNQVLLFVTVTVVVE